jgi:hypothetical protein
MIHWDVATRCMRFVRLVVSHNVDRHEQKAVPACQIETVDTKDAHASCIMRHYNKMEMATTVCSHDSFVSAFRWHCRRNVLLSVPAWAQWCQVCCRLVQYSILVRTSSLTPSFSLLFLQKSRMIRVQCQQSSLKVHTRSRRRWLLPRAMARAPKGKGWRIHNSTLL